MLAPTYGADQFEMIRCIKVMNRRLQRDLGYDVAEKVGHRWALTAFMGDVWGSEKEEIERQGWPIDAYKGKKRKREVGIDGFACF